MRNGEDRLIETLLALPIFEADWVLWVLVLLVILMVTSTSLVKASFGVDLPRAASAGEVVDRTLNVLIRADGVLLLDGREVDERGLAEGVKRALAANPEVRAVISADQQAP